MQRKIDEASRSKGLFDSYVEEQPKRNGDWLCLSGAQQRKKAVGDASLKNKM